MIQLRTFITDAQWQKRQHQQLLAMAADAEMARKLVDKLDANPDLRQGLWDVYCSAKRTLGELDC